jgi:hypothetical protein
MRRIVAVRMAAVLVCPMTMTACGASDGPTPSDAMSAAAQRVRDVKTVSAVFSMTVKVGGRERTRIAFRGTQDRTGTRGRLRMRYLKGGGRAFSPRSDVEMILRAADGYVSSPEIIARLPAGKRWVHLTDDEVADPSLSFAQTFALMEKAGGVEDLGEERVRDRVAERYRGKVEVQDAIDAIGPDRFTPAKRQTFKQLADVSLPIEVWITPDGLPLRLRVDLKGGGVQTVMDAVITAWDPPLDTNAPPAAQVLEGGKLGP